jgi:glutaconate CoA-transferase subunit B
VDDVTVDERMAVAMAREVREGDFMSHGASVPLAAAALMLAKQTHAPNLDFFYQGTITTGERDPANLLLDMEAIFSKAPAFLSQAGITDFELRGGADFQFLRPAQIDAYGNVNASLIGTLDEPWLRFHGIAVADAMCVVRRLCLYTTEHTPRVFAEKLDFVTGLGHRDRGRWRDRLGLPGAGPTSVITPLAIMDFETEDCRMRLREMYEGVTVDEVRAATGFDLAVADVVTIYKPPDDLVMRLRAIDPLATRQMEFRETRQAARARLDAVRADNRATS